MVDIPTISKPQIWLEGTTVNGSSFSQRVDHAKNTPSTSTLTIGGVTQLDEENDNILSFFDDVRVIITTVATPRKYYARTSGKLSSLEFEGKHNVSLINVNEVAETYYTLNGKEPVRTRANIYNYRDRNNTDNGDLGFILSASSTGSNLITVKAATYQNGCKSRIAIATFKIIQTQNTLKFNNVKNQQS